MNLDYLTERDLFIERQLLVEPGKKPERLDLFLKQQLPQVSRNRVQEAIKGNHVFVNKQIKKNSYLIRGGDLIDLKLPPPPSKTAIKPEKLPLDIIYEDESLLVVNKAAEMVVHPGLGNWTGTLVHGLLYHFSKTKQPHNLVRAGLVHRIDKGTSGPLVVAKNPYALTYLSDQFFKKEVERTYIALVWGAPPQNAGKIEHPICRSSGDRRLRVICSPTDPLGKASVTHYQVLERLGHVTLVQCQLETGRTHQIRVHMRSLGCPLFGDPKYGGQKVVRGPIFSKYTHFVKGCFEQLPFQALHASTLGFIHPKSKQKLSFKVAPPEAFTKICEKWRRYAHQGTHRLITN